MLKLNKEFKQQMQIKIRSKTSSNPNIKMVNVMKSLNAEKRTFIAPTTICKPIGFRLRGHLKSYQDLLLL